MMRDLVLMMDCDVDGKWSQVYVRVVDPEMGEIVNEWGDMRTFTPLADLCSRSFALARRLYGDNLSVYQQFHV